MSEVEKPTIAETFKREPIWTEMDVGYVSQEHVPDWREAARILSESIGGEDHFAGEEGLDECHLRWLDDPAERARLAERAGIALDPDEGYFQECGAAEGEPFWRIEF